MLSLAHLRTFFTASFIALVIAACGGSSGDGASAGSNIAIMNTNIPQPEYDIFNDRRVEASSPIVSSSISQEKIEALLSLKIIKSAVDARHTKYDYVNVVPVSGSQVAVQFSIPSNYNVQGVYLSFPSGNSAIPLEFSINPYFFPEEVGIRVYEAAFLVPEEEFLISMSGVTQEGVRFEGSYEEIFFSNGPVDTGF